MTRIFVLIALFILSPAWTWAASYEVSNSTSIVDGDTFCGGAACKSSDTIIIKGGARGSILFRDFNGKGSYITIMNENTNRVVITHDGAPARGSLGFKNCKYIDFRGNNNASFTYGIKVVNDGTPNTPAGTVWFFGESDHIKLSYIKVVDDGAQGTISVGIKVPDNDLTNAWTFDTFEIHHNYIQDSRYHGMYLGHARPHYTGSDQECTDGCPYVANFSIHDNILEDLGCSGFTYKGVKTGSVNYIYNNTIRRNGLRCTGALSRSGISASYYYGSAYAKIYNNRIEKTYGPGLKVGEADHLIHDNLLLGCGTGNSTIWGHGIALHNGDSMPNRPERTVRMYENTIVEATRYGIKANNASGYHYRNIIAESGIGEVHSYGTLTEGTGTNANIYEADADDLGFKVWSDDGDYSNDDFSLLMLPAPSLLHIVE